MTDPVTLPSGWGNHPLLKAWATPQQITINCLIRVWDSQSRLYVPLNDYSTGNPVTVTIKDNVTNSIKYFISSAGTISGSIDVIPLRNYTVTFWIAGLKFGFRTYPLNYSVLIQCKMVSGSIELLPATINIPTKVYPFYAEYNKEQGNIDPYLEYLYTKHASIKEFEDNYNIYDRNILCEGDSWFNNPTANDDLYSCIKRMLTGGATKTKKPAAFLPLQRWAHTSYEMLHVSQTEETQRAYLEEYLNRYTFDLTLISAGGNDFALSFRDYIRPGLGPATIAQAKQIALSKNLAVDFDFPGDYSAVAAHVLSAVGTAFDAIRFPEPPVLSAVTPYEDIVDLVLDRVAIDNRFIAIRGWFLELAAIKPTIPIIAHTYCYPLYKNTGTVFPWSGPWNLDGPFMHPALQSKGAINRVLQTLCIKALMDAFAVHVLQEVATAAANFHFADLRPYALDATRWDDEMHLTPFGAQLAAWPLYNKIRSVCGAQF
jgi:hypothetical protein